MKARERIIRRYLAGSEKFEAVVAIETAALAPQIGYWASRQLAVKLGCPVALWRLAYLCAPQPAIPDGFVLVPKKPTVSR